MSQSASAFGLAGLLGICVVGIFEIPQMGVFDWPLRIALGAFALAFPLLVLGSAVLGANPDLRFPGAFRWEGQLVASCMLLFWIGGVGVAVGLIALLCHFEGFLGAVFAEVCALAVVCYLGMTRLNLERLKRGL